MEGTVASGGEIWLRDVGTAKSGLVLETWLIGGDENEHARKESGNGKAKKGGAIFSEEDREFCFSYCFAYDILLNCVFILKLDDTGYRYW